MRLQLKWTVMLFFAALQLSFAQEKNVSGTVTDESGIPLPGVTVLVKESTKGTQTDFDGNYQISVQEGKTLVFSYVGMKSAEKKVGKSSVINVVLQTDAQELGEVVVTALGISKEKKALGYATQEVGEEQLNQGANPDIQTAISGKVSGVQIRQSSGMPGAPSQIYIRGARSFSGNNAPLYVIDGLPVTSNSDYGSNVTGVSFSNRALDINPNDIESINILKGQAAAALYGLRASNGVIIITTKKGKGNKVGKPVISYTSSVTMDKVSVLPEVQSTYGQGSKGAFVPANSLSWGPKIVDLPKDPTYGGDNYAGHSGEFFDPYKNQWVTPKAYNNPKNFFSQMGFTYSNNLNLSQRLESGNYSVGLGYTKQEGIVPNTGMDRYTAKFAGDFDVNKIWKVGFSGNLSVSDINKLPSGNDSWLFTVYGAPPSYDLMGTPYHQEGTNGKYRQISYRRGGVGQNPLWAIENNYFNEKTKRFFGNGYVQYNPKDWVTVKYQLGSDFYTTNNSDYTEMGKANLPSASEYPTPNNRVYTYIAPTGGEINKFGVTRSVLNSLLTATFSHEFSDSFSGDILIGNEIDQNNSEYYRIKGTGFTTPGWDNMSNTNTQNSNYDMYRRRTVGFFSNINLSYNSMLYLNLTGRQDIVSSMPRNNRTFFYPSASLSWVLTELQALKDSNFLSFAKIRTSYAEVGQAADEYISKPYYVKGGASSGYLQYGVVYPWQSITGYKASSTVFDPNLVPQNTKNYEVGIETKFFNNRVSLDYTYFNQFSENQIFPVPMAGSTGYSSFITNAGSMKSVGHEVVLNVVPVRSDNFEWDITANFTKIVNVVEKLADGVDNIFLGGYTDPNIRASAGDTYPAIYGVQFKKDKQGRVLVNEDPTDDGYGLPMAGEFGKIGEVSPDFIMTFNNRFTILKDISIFAQLDWKNGGQIYSGSNYLMDLYGTSKRTEDRESVFVYEGYLSNGQPNNIQRGGATDTGVYQYMYTSLLGSIRESLIYDSSYLKLREVGISYNLPKSMISKANISNISIGFVARNFLLWSKLPNFDPEASQGQGNMAGGMDYMSLPQTSSYGLNFNITF